MFEQRLWNMLDLVMAQVQHFQMCVFREHRFVQNLQFIMTQIQVSQQAEFYERRALDIFDIVFAHDQSGEIRKCG